MASPADSNDWNEAAWMVAIFPLLSIVLFVDQPMKFVSIDTWWLFCLYLLNFSFAETKRTQNYVSHAQLGASTSHAMQPHAILVQECRFPGLYNRFEAQGRRGCKGCVLPLFWRSVVHDFPMQTSFGVHFLKMLDPALPVDAWCA